MFVPLEVRWVWISLESSKGFSSFPFRFVVSFVYYGIAMNVSDLGGNVYINFLISAATEFPAYGVGWALPHYCGRVIPLSVLFILSGVSLLLVAAVPACKYWCPTQMPQRCNLLSVRKHLRVYLQIGVVHDMQETEHQMSTNLSRILPLFCFAVRKLSHFFIVKLNGHALLTFFSFELASGVAGHVG